MGAQIYVISGEGEVGTRETYAGKMTVRALKLRLARERCGGDRWARLEVEGRLADAMSPEDAIKVARAARA